MKIHEGMGFQKLTQAEQDAYRIIGSFLNAFSTTIDASKIDNHVDSMKVLQTILGDNPEVIYFDKTQIMVTELLFKKQLKLFGCPSRTRLNKMNSDLAVKVNSIVASIKNSTYNDFQKIKAIYEYLQKNVIYDEKELVASSSGKSRNQNSHNSYGALVDGLAVCDGISAAFNLLAQKIGYECMTVSGRSTFRADRFIKHAWNIIKVNNEFYHVDATWDLNQFTHFNEFVYEYFFLTDDEIANDHEWKINTTPVCRYTEMSYYSQNNLYATNNTQLEDIIKKCISVKQNVIRFKISYNISLPSDPGKYLSNLLLNSAVKAWRSAQIQYLWNENTRCFMAKMDYK